MSEFNSINTVYEEEIMVVKKNKKITTDWILRVGNGENFKMSSKYRIWGISSTVSANKCFLKNVKQGDRLWFVKSKSQGKLLAVAKYISRITDANLDLLLIFRALMKNLDGLEVG
jgi:hypothetical protein